MPPVDVMSPVPDPRNQQPLDLDFEILIVPDAIPIPGTSVEVLQAAVSAMRTAAGEVAEGGEGIESTWQGLQPHYTAPESETLFAAMGPVAAKGGTILDDVTTVASALDTFADAAQTAKTTLSALKDEATTFAEEMREKENWSANPLDYSENRRLKLQVNGVWATFQEAERTCANAISAVSGSGNSYVAASGEAPGAGEIVYGLDPDDVPDVAYDLTSVSDWQRILEDSWNHLEYSEKPWPADWATDAFMAQWDNFGPGMLWDVGVGAVAWTGLWREGSGWANSVGEATDNFFTNKQETLEGLGSLTGLYGEDGWMNPFDSGERSGETWRANAGAAWTEVAHDIVPWREWEDRPAYTVYTGAGNAALAVVSLPARGGTILANLSRGGSGLPDLDPVDRPEVVWEPGAAARPGFSLSQTFSDISGDFSDTAEGFGAGFGDLSAMIDRFSAGGPAGGGVPGEGGGSDLPVFVPEPGGPWSERPVTAPVSGDHSGDPDRPGRGDEDRSGDAPNFLDAPSTERWPEMEEFLDSEHRRGDEGQSVADRDPEFSEADFARPLDVTADEGSNASPDDRLFSSLGLNAGEIEREYERDVERTTRQVVDTVEEFRALPAERQLEWLRVNQLVGANVGGPQNSGFGGFGNEDFGITASHDPNSGNGGGPPRTPQDGTSNTGFTPGGDGGGDGDTSRRDTTGSRPNPESGGRPGRPDTGWPLDVGGDGPKRPASLSEDDSQVAPVVPPVTQAPLRDTADTAGFADPRTIETSSNSEAPDADDKKDDGNSPDPGIEQSDSSEHAGVFEEKNSPGHGSGDGRSAIERSGLDTENGKYPEGGDHPAPDPNQESLAQLNDGRILGRIPENLVERDGSNRIVSVGGSPLDTWQTDLLKERAKEFKQHVEEAKRANPSDKNMYGPAMIGKKGGAVNSIVVDRVSGLVAEGMNGGKASLIPAGEGGSLNEIIRQRVTEMEGKYRIFSAPGVEREYHYPHGDEPLRHAEVKALNRLLNERPGADVADFQIDNWFSLKEDSKDPWDCPCCANCNRLTEGTRVYRAGRNTHTPFDPRNRRIYDE
ncbi:hypothetical protein AB0M72_25295 [Nocardiopsis dassonvillei]|uniref:hypothetical protein n=1 Tax=Nocardiopsis dassonvillei TaxID=2014 RepID=UPI00200E7C4A|nr:hypothetical protein [Nocardiopsis dassonvillei]MCK9872524.1 hypothetical protein [Nocardiopsis dassonvillei]